MHRSTLPRHARAHAPGWSHPYPVDPWSPMFYVDGGDGQDDDADGDDDGDQVDEADSDDTEAQGGSDDTDPEGADKLGDPGKRALASMKGKWRAERDRAKELERKLAEKDGADETETVRRKAEADATAKANGRILRAEVKAAAAGKLADPADAYKFLDLDQFEVDDDGNVDSEEVAEAIEELIKNKPYLAAATAKRFQGTADGGAARKAGRPKQLTKQDLKTMSADQIVAAQDAGQLDDYLSAG
ncbi:hypothetical protein ACFYPC_11345 [Streptomyces sp. NPDC005808]|uniref:hypothetical protein n=1 Tax=Streptomyces sp. NPDC005808 TaxID=3364734 RepID=UPI0036CE171D